MVFCDCHIHMVLDGSDWKAALAAHRVGPNEAILRSNLSRYRDAGFVYLREGGDRWGVGALARALAPEYGIQLATPLSPLHMAGHYGGFIGTGFENLREYALLVIEQRQKQADFIKIMISGLMDFDRPGVLTEPGLEPAIIREMIHIAHEEGMPVMAHANGARTVEAAAAVGVDSIEHGAYLDEAALDAMKGNGTIWVPTLSTIGNLLGKGRFDDGAVRAILASAAENIRKFAGQAGLLAPGTDAGAWAVPHGSLTEYTLFRSILPESADAVLQQGARAIMEKFPAHTA